MVTPILASFLGHRLAARQASGNSRPSSSARSQRASSHRLRWRSVGRPAAGWRPRQQIARTISIKQQDIHIRPWTCVALGSRGWSGQREREKERENERKKERERKKESERERTRDPRGFRWPPGSRGGSGGLHSRACPQPIGF